MGLLHQPGEVIKAIRNFEGLTLQAFSEKSGISETDLQAIEKGDINLNDQQLSTIAKALNCVPWPITMFCIDGDKLSDTQKTFLDHVWWALNNPDKL